MIEKIERTTQTLLLDLDKRRSSSAYLTLTLIQPKGEYSTVKLKRGESITIGRSHKCNIVVELPYISKSHIMIQNIDNSHCLVTDLNSKNGTFVNNIKVTEAKCKSGDIIKIGELEIIIGEKLVKHNGYPFLFEGFIGGVSHSSLQLKEELEKASKLDCNLLIEGESGTGKELCARFIHENSRRRNYPFVTVNCGSFIPEIAYNELFGHEKGSFTGAIATQIGVFQAANKGTLFLDEIGELPLELQPLFLRAIEYGFVKKIGSIKEEKVDVRIIGATNRNLVKEIKMGKFRADLFHRITEYTIRIPSLSERREDIPYIVLFYFEKITKATGIEKSITEDAIKILADNDWSGNVRELRNFIYSLVVSVEDKVVGSAHVKRMLEKRESIESSTELERYIETIIRNKGNITRSAYELGVPKSTLRDRLKRFISVFDTEKENDL